MRIHPGDAQSRNLSDGQIVRVFNDRGSCLAGLVISDRLRPGVVQLSTGTWYDPDADGNCRHGNPNVLTADLPTSQLSQACSGQHTLVEIEGSLGTSNRSPSCPSNRSPSCCRHRWIGQFPAIHAEIETQRVARNANNVMISNPTFR
jgi:predicted molibdopterin-dependent oxidoreductase YjgC